MHGPLNEFANRIIKGVEGFFPNVTFEHTQEFDGMADIVVDDADVWFALGTLYKFHCAHIEDFAHSADFRPSQVQSLTIQEIALHVFSMASQSIAGLHPNSTTAEDLRATEEAADYIVNVITNAFVRSLNPRGQFDLYYQVLEDRYHGRCIQKIITEITEKKLMKPGSKQEELLQEYLLNAELLDAYQFQEALEQRFDQPTKTKPTLEELTEFIRKFETFRLTGQNTKPTSPANAD